MRKWYLAAVAAAALAGSANAGIVTLEAVTPNGPADFTFDYQWTLGPDEGLRSGDRLVVFDFSGYIAESEFSTAADVIASTELVSPGAAVPPGFDDDPAVANLVFTYTGQDFRTIGGPFGSFDISGFGARSTFSGRREDGFFALSTKNNPDGVPGGSGTPVFSLGAATVPAAIPEPATWAMMLGGFGMAGAVVRRRARTKSVLA